MVADVNIKQETVETVIRRSHYHHYHVQGHQRSSTVIKGHQNVSSKCPIQISYQNAPSKCLIKMSYQKVPSKWPIKMSH